CNGHVLRDPGFKSCDLKEVFFTWNEAPNTYCVMYIHKRILKEIDTFMVQN
ncbi:12276_t:CDS:1, partial [Gigaspora margarita]